jgi:hypothetical protein
MDGQHFLKMVSASGMDGGSADNDATEKNLKSVETLGRILLLSILNS